MNPSEAKPSSPLLSEQAGFKETVQASAPAMPGIFAWGMVTGMAWITIFLLGDAVKLPAKVKHALRYAPAAALAAIVAPDLFLSGDALQVSVLNPKLLAAAGAAAFFVATRHMLGTIGLGMLLYTGLRLLM